jgi:hypothetical protein
VKTLSPSKGGGTPKEKIKVEEEMEEKEERKRMKRMLSKAECSLLRKVCACGYGVYEEMKERVECYKERKIVLPWSGEEEGCKSIKYNMGLYTQCGESVLSGESKYCVGCVKEYSKKGEHRYGTVEERKVKGIMEYKDPRGKGVVRYTEIMKKLNLTKEEVLSEAKRRGVEVAECHFEEKSAKRGRPRKEKEVVGEKKKRGRPKKEKEMVSNKAGEDLIASLLNESKAEREDPIGGKTMSGCEKATAKEPVVDPKEKAEPKEPSADKDKEKSKPKENVKPSADTADEEEEETVVIKYEIDGITYLKSEDNVLYDIKTHDCVGIWNELTKKIDEIPDEDEDEDN